MDHLFDEFSKSLSESVPRRESLRRLGAVFAGTVLGPLGIETAWAARQDPCKTFCKCRNAQQQNKCLAACNACGKNTGRLCGACGTYVCCAQPGPNEYGACVSGTCEYWCVEGTVRCSGTCADVASDPDNCGACGNACGGSTPVCIDGTCGANPCVFPFIPCGGVCVDPSSDRDNCGGCDILCGPFEACIGGFCESGGG